MGLNRVRVLPRHWSTAVHVHGRSEELFYVLGGAGLSWQDGAVHEIGPRDVLVHHARGPAHSLLAGDAGLDVLAFGPRLPDEGAHLPRAGVSWLGPRWVEAGGEHPWQREAAVGPPEVPAPSARPATIARADEVEPRAFRGRTVSRTRADLGQAVGSRTTGMKLYDIAPGMLSAPPHCHSAEEELFVVLDGDGTFVVGEDEHAVRAGHVAARPPGTGISHVFRGGSSGLRLLAYGTREPNDICFYPRSGKIAFGGVGVIGRLEPLDYWQGED